MSAPTDERWNPALPEERRAQAVHVLRCNGTAMTLDVPLWQAVQAEADGRQLELQWGGCLEALRVVQPRG